jgi:hypothetical protein
MEGSESRTESRSVQSNEGPGPGRPKNIGILRIRIHNTDFKTVPTHSRGTIRLRVPDSGVAGDFALVESPLGENLAGGGEHTFYKVVVELHPEQNYQWGLVEVGWALYK